MSDLDSMHTSFVFALDYRNYCAVVVNECDHDEFQQISGWSKDRSDVIRWTRLAKDINVLCDSLCTDVEKYLLLRSIEDAVKTLGQYWS
jgi:hypothetical protein